MSFSIEPKKGIRLKLSGYQPIRSWQAGGKFWEHDFHLTIRQGHLADFLPRAAEEGDSVFYEQVVDGREVVSGSEPISSTNPVPPAQIAALQTALGELKTKADDPLCDPTKRKIIEAFRLPDPTKDAELYRTYGSGRHRRLLVLWGVEKEAGSALAPLQAIGRMPRHPAGGRAGGSWWWLLLLLALLIGGWFYWRSQQPSGEDGRGNGRASANQSTAPSAGGNSGALPGSGVERSPGAPGSEGSPDAAPRPDMTPGDSSTPSTLAPSGKAPASGGGIGSLPGNSPSPNTPSSVASPGVSPALDNPRIAPSPSGSASPLSASDHSTPSPDGPATPSSSNPSTAPAKSLAAQPTQTIPPSPSALRSPSPAPSGKPVSTPLKDRNTPEPSPSVPASPSAPATTLSTPPASPSPKSSPGAKATSHGTPPPPTPPQNALVDPAGTAPTPSGATQVPSGSETAPRLTSLEISKGSTTAAPKNGKVEVILSALGRDPNGIPSTPSKINQWFIDGAVFQGADNKPFAGPTLPVMLGEGSHHVIVTTTTVDGRQLKGEADVDVKIKVTEESNVQVRPVPR